MMIQMLEKFNMLEQSNKLLSPAEGMLNTPREDILIAGGFRSRKSTKVSSSKTKGWFSSKEKHPEASSLIYDDQFFVARNESYYILHQQQITDHYK
mgnify:CR=1 FL=1